MSKKDDAEFLPPGRATAGSTITIKHPLIAGVAESVFGVRFSSNGDIDVNFESKTGDTATLILPDKVAAYIVSLLFRSTREPEEVGRYIVDPPEKI